MIEGFDDRIRFYSGVPKNYRDYLVSDIETKNADQERFISLLKELYQGRIWSVLVLGTVGNGKTTIACSAVNHWNYTHVFFDEEPAYYKTQASLTMEYKETFRPEAERTESQVFNLYAKKARLLVIDELNPNEWSEFNKSLIQKILVERHANKKRTVIIGNLTEKDLRNMFDPHILSRLREGGSMYMTSPDLRKREN